MKRVLVILLAVSLLSGCAWIKGTKGTAAKPMIITKTQATITAKDFLSERQFNDQFVLRKPCRIQRLMTMEKESRWVWRVYFASRERRWWKFWKRSPMMVEVDGNSGLVRHWGRR